MRKALFFILALCSISRVALLPTLTEGFEAEMAVHASDPAQEELRLINRSPEALGPGTLTLYAEDAAGRRERVAGAVLQVTEPVPPGAPLLVLSFTPPPGATGYTLVFEGQLGHEAGAVVAIKVRRGVSKPE